MDVAAQETNLKLIREIKRRPILYDKHLPNFSRKSEQEKAWEEVAQCMKWKASRCKYRWRNLRCVYLRHVKKLSQGATGKLPYLMSAMHFALKFMKPSYCKISERLLEGYDENNDGEDFVVNDEDQEHIETRKSFECLSSNQPSPVASESSEPNFSFVTEYMPSTSGRVKHEEDSLTLDQSKAAGSNDIQVEISDMITNIELKNDAKKMFLLSLLPDVYAMTDAQMRKFKREVLNIIGNIFDNDN